MVRPVPVGIPVTAEYGIPGDWQCGHHTGRDYGCPAGTPVFATYPGKVVGLGNIWGASYGMHQVIIESTYQGVVRRHGYCHMSAYQVTMGQTVKAGQRIGTSGYEGNVKPAGPQGAHLHYEERTAPFLYANRDVQPVLDSAKDPDMSLRTCVDYSDARPDLHALKAQGHEGVIRYTTAFGGPKQLGRAEAEAIHEAGLWFIIVYEDGIGDPDKGAPEGKADGEEAVRDATALGYQRDATIVLAFDRNNYDLTPGTPPYEYAQAWIAAVIAGGFIPKLEQRGGYGNYNVSHSTLFGMHWKVETWGGDNSGVHLIQMVNSNPRPTPGCDTNVIQHSFPVCTKLNPPGWTPPKPEVEPVWFHNVRRELVMGIGGTTAANEWGRRYRIANNIGVTGKVTAAPGKTVEPAPNHAANALAILKENIPNVPSSDVYGYRARQMYNVLRGIKA